MENKKIKTREQQQIETLEAEVKKLKHDIRIRNEIIGSLRWRLYTSLRYADELCRRIGWKPLSDGDLGEEPEAAQRGRHGAHRGADGGRGAVYGGKR